MMQYCTSNHLLLPDTFDGYDFNIDIINDDEYNALQQELLMLFETYCCVFGDRELSKNLLCLYFNGSKQDYVWK